MKFLYLFPHIPKTGGAALFENVERSLPRSECLRLNCTHQQYYHDPRTGGLRFYETTHDFESLLHSLNQEERFKFRFLSGHDLSFGLHQEFPQPARYFTFIREPIARTISLYNYQRYQHEFLKKMKKMDESHRRLDLFSQKWFLRNGKIPSFEEWLVESYDGDYPFYWTMSRFLKHYGYLDNMAEKFFFIGLTETMEEDELYMYYKMGIRRFWANRNASFPYVSQRQLTDSGSVDFRVLLNRFSISFCRGYIQSLILPLQKESKGGQNNPENRRTLNPLAVSQLDARIVDLIRQKNQDDFAIYEQAKALNFSFKSKESDFYQIVEKMRWKKIRSYLKEKTLIPLYHKLREYL